MFLIKTQIAFIFSLLFWSNIHGFIIKDNRKIKHLVENGTNTKPSFPIGLSVGHKTSQLSAIGAPTRKISEKTEKDTFAGNFQPEVRQVKLRTQKKGRRQEENHELEITQNREKRSAIGKVKQIKSSKHHKKKKDKERIPSKPDPFLPMLIVFVLILIIAVFLTAFICSVQFERERLTKRNQEALDAGFSDKVKNTGIFPVGMRVLGRYLYTCLCCKFKHKLKEIPLFQIESSSGTGKTEYLSASYIERLNDEKLDHLLGKKVSHTSGRAKSSPARPITSTVSAEERRAISLPNNRMSSSLHKRSVAEAGKKRSSIHTTDQHRKSSGPTMRVGSFDPPQYVDSMPPAPGTSYGATAHEQNKHTQQGYNRGPHPPPLPPRH